IQDYYFGELAWNDGLLPIPMITFLPYWIHTHAKGFALHTNDTIFSTTIILIISLHHVTFHSPKIMLILYFILILFKQSYDSVSILIYIFITHEFNGLQTKFGKSDIRIFSNVYSNIKLLRLIL
ncbi:hypothetical protein ACJX0J_009752, partial [Zea mays]